MASVISRATGIGLTWDALEALTDDASEQRLYGRRLPGRVVRPRPDPAWIHTELRRAGVTLELLHLEYLQQHAEGYRYSAFSAHYRDWFGHQRVSMRQVHPMADGPRSSRVSSRAIAGIEHLGDPTAADAILDLVVHRAHRVERPLLDLDAANAR